MLKGKDDVELALILADPHLDLVMLPLIADTAALTTLHLENTTILTFGIPLTMRPQSRPVQCSGFTVKPMTLIEWKSFIDLW